MKETTKLASGLEFYRDFENSEGAICMTNAKTVKRYHELKYESQPDCDKYGVFFAFSNEQFENGYKRLVELGHIKDGDKVKRYSESSGLFGASVEKLKSFFGFYADKDKLIREECDPQEVYFYEYNNHECMYDWEGDENAIKIIIDVWGVDVARTIVRFSDSQTIDYIMTPRDVKQTWSMLGRLEADCKYYLGNGNRYAKSLWAQDEKGQIAKMRELLASLPEQYRENCITSEQIDEYERKMVG